MSDPILARVEGRVLIITMNRPEARNAMSAAMAEAISRELDRLEADDRLACAILTGAQTFCSGMDLKGFLRGELPTVPGRGFGGLTEWSPSKPVIAAIEGYAVAGGLELAIACDLIVAHRDARLGISEAKRGLVAGGGGLVRLPRLLPRNIAMELALTGDPIDATRAHALGLVNEVTDGPAVDAALRLAERIGQCGPLAVRVSKAVIRDSAFWPDNAINELQAPYIDPIFTSADAREGATAFAEKRAPQWTGH